MSKEEKIIWPVGKQTLLKELNDYTVPQSPRIQNFVIPLNEDGEVDKNGKHGAHCLYCDFKTWTRVRWLVSHDPDNVCYSVHIGSDTLVEGVIAKEFFSVLEKHWKQGNPRSQAAYWKVLDWIMSAEGAY